MSFAHHAGPSRRSFLGLLGAAASAPGAPSQSKLKIGHTGITWGNDIETAIADVSSLGFYGFETFGNVVESWEQRGGLRRVLDEHQLPLVSAYCSFDLVDPVKRKDELEKMKRWAGLIKTNGGHVTVLGPNSVTRSSYDFRSSKSNIVETLNECSKMLTDMGIVPALHQHTGTCIETRDEVYAVLDAVDTRYVKFGPDIGQLQKGGVDPVKVVKDYLPLVRHLHLKDYDGGNNYLGYCPLGQGKVDVPAVLELVQGADMQGMVMVELDPSPNMPLKPGQTARIAKGYLEKLGYTLRF